MSSRRRSSRSRASTGGATRISDEQIRDLVAKLQALLPEACLRSNDRVRTLIPPPMQAPMCVRIEIRSASSTHFNSTVLYVSTSRWCRRRGCCRRHAAISGACTGRSTISATASPSCSPPLTSAPRRPPSSAASSCSRQRIKWPPHVLDRLHAGITTE